MDTKDLWSRLEAYGADMRGIDDRFMGDVGLYYQCFQELLAEPNFNALDDAVAHRCYQNAFQAAHALKGLSGNLGLTPFYDAICALVESLRAKDYRNINEEYANVAKALAQLRALDSAPSSPAAPALEAAPTGKAAPQQAQSDTSAALQKKNALASVADSHQKNRASTPAAAASPAKPQPVDTGKRKPWRRRWLLSFLAVAWVMTLIIVLFIGMVNRYKANVELESVNHLTEISQQIQIYIEEKIADKWRVVHSLASGLRRNARDYTEAEALALIGEERDIWGVSDVTLYTEGGFAIDADGSIKDIDSASEIAYQAGRHGEYMSVVESSILYAVPLDTEMKIGGQRLAAISITYDMSSFLDNMRFSSFGGEAYIYLTQTDGTVISKLSHPKTKNVYNFLSLLEGRKLTRMGPDKHWSPDIMLHSREAVSILMDDDDGRTFVVSTPIGDNLEGQQLFYLVPDESVNKTLNSFSTYVTGLCIIIIAMLAVVLLVASLLVYRANKRQFDEALLSREHMFDLLVTKSSTAFGLVAANRKQPVYCSANTERIIGEKYLTLEKTSAGFTMGNAVGTETEIVRQIREELAGWEGDSPFHSGFIRRPDGQYFSFELYPSGNGGEYIAIAQDATVSHQRGEAVKAALQMAERSNAAKSRFLSNMSHDIRTPMNAILNMTDFALESFSTPRVQREYLNTIRESSEHLLHLINDVLDMSRIESGQTVVDVEPFDLKAELRRLEDIVRPLCEAKQQIFITDFSGLTVTGVKGDMVKLSQVLMNLLSNAVKFTPEKGAVRFSATELPSLRTNIAEVRFTVEDNGIGISRENQQTIFEPFARAEDQQVSHIEGTGLGLSICKSYVTAMGGVITCQSEENNGSTFTVELFFQKADMSGESKSVRVNRGEKPFMGKRCLVCEDNPTNQTIAKTILERLGFMVDLAVDGKEGLRKFLSVREGTYDVIYMDIQMPGMDGYHTANAIRNSRHGQAETIPIIAMTANVFAEDVEKARLAGMNGHIGKPIITLDLIEETWRLLNETEGQAE